MRDLDLEAAIWNLFTSPRFFEAAARECERIVELYGARTLPNDVELAPDREMVAKFVRRAGDFRRGAELARCNDYHFVYKVAGSIHGDIRGIIEQVGWMNLDRFTAFSGGRFERVGMLADRIESVLYNALVGAECFYHPDPECPERSDDDDGYPGGSIVGWCTAYLKQLDTFAICTVPDPLPAYVVDISTACRTGDRVPSTGVWYPSTGLDGYSLTYAIKGFRMQPAFRITKTEDELRAEGIWSGPETVAVATTWYPVISSVTQTATSHSGGRP